MPGIGDKHEDMQVMLACVASTLEQDAEIAAVALQRQEWEDLAEYPLDTTQLHADEGAHHNFTPQLASAVKQRRQEDNFGPQFFGKVFSPLTQTIPFFQLLNQFLPGQAPRNINPDDAASAGHVHLVRQLGALGRKCSSAGADAAAAQGHLDVIRELKHQGIHCTAIGKRLATENGHSAVVAELLVHDVEPNEDGSSEFEPEAS